MASTKLQRGLGIAAEDRLLEAEQQDPAEVASTGPRHRCRGSPPPARPRWAASRWLQRGLGIAAEDRARSARRRLRRRVGFNGASASLPRIAVARSRRSRPRPSSFNGASASLPRIGSCGGTPGAGRRRFNGASASLPRIVEHVALPREASAQASTGPRHRCRGSRAASAYGASPTRWASTGPRHRCRGSILSSLMSSLPSVRFNGASASLPRIGRRGTEPVTPSTLLQRGLGIAAEDRKGCRTVFDEIEPASTGPRHRCRGSSSQRVDHMSPSSASTGPRHRCRGSVWTSS